MEDLLCCAFFCKHHQKCPRSASLHSCVQVILFVCFFFFPQKGDLTSLPVSRGTEKMKKLYLTLLEGPEGQSWSLIRPGGSRKYSGRERKGLGITKRCSGGLGWEQAKHGNWRHTLSPVQDLKRNTHPLCREGQRDGLKDIGKTSQST